MREHMKDRRADDNFTKHKNEKRVPGSNIKSKHLGTGNTRLLKKAKLNPEHVREIEQCSFRKREAENL